MTDKEKRKLVEDALFWLFQDFTPSDSDRDYFFDSLAEQAIVVPVEVTYKAPWTTRLGRGGPETLISDAQSHEVILFLDGHLGKPGKAVAIILPLPEEK